MAERASPSDWLIGAGSSFARIDKHPAKCLCKDLKRQQRHHDDDPRAQDDGMPMTSAKKGGMVAPG